MEEQKKYEIGEVICEKEPITINEGSKTVSLVVRNSGDRTVQVCSHYHFFECNDALIFDRESAFGMHLDIPSGTAVRFEPGADHLITLVPYKGKRNIFGFAGSVMGHTDDPDIKEKALKNYKEGQ